ncbi:hypothetical protein ACFU90_23080 [Streptomyces noursei]|uniref:hypothetical protein n=1 Tax=Streptomyces noursei TaxID=1971 RepID=UPI000A682712|nr:hypothetical protein [Streptomyces noursei]
MQALQRPSTVPSQAGEALFAGEGVGGRGEEAARPPTHGRGAMRGGSYVQP